MSQERTNIEKVYDFEGVLEEAFAAVFMANELVTRSSEDDPEFQTERPRIEVFVFVGESVGPLFPHAEGKLVVGNDKGSEQQYDASCQIRVITEPDKLIHRAMRSTVRFICRTMVNRINYTYLPYHSVDMFKSSGTSYDFKPQEDGYYMSILTYQFKFSIQANAWALLAAE